jgi:hypothetical protein
MSKWLHKLRDSGALRLPLQGMHPYLFYADDALFFCEIGASTDKFSKLSYLHFKRSWG